jgi:hypothetical protein
MLLFESLIITAGYPYSHFFLKKYSRTNNLKVTDLNELSTKTISTGPVHSMVATSAHRLYAGFYSW